MEGKAALALLSVAAVVALSAIPLAQAGYSRYGLRWIWELPSPPSAPGVGGIDRFNITIVIQDPENLTSLGEMRFNVILTNDNSYAVKGTVWTWFENALSGKRYNAYNESVFLPAQSQATINRTEFLFLVPGEYRLMAEHIREPSFVRDMSESPFSVGSPVGYVGLGERLTPMEAGVLIVFVILIVIVSFAIATYFHYGATEKQRPEQ